MCFCLSDKFRVKRCSLHFTNELFPTWKHIFRWIFRWRRAGKGLRNDVLCISLNMNEDYVAQIDAFSRDLVLKFPRALGCLSSVAITEMIRLLLLFCSWQLAESSDNCACTGIGLGANQRGFPDSYGESCAAWDDGDCTRHDCGPLKECAEMWPGLQIRALKFQSLSSNFRELELSNFLGLVLGCIEAKFCK